MIKPVELFSWMLENVPGKPIVPPKKEQMEQGFENEAPTPSNLNWIFQNLSKWINYTSVGGYDAKGKLTEILPATGGKRLLVTESETIDETIRIDQSDVVIDFQPGVTITGSTSVLKMIEITGRRVSISNARIGFEEVVTGSTGYRIIEAESDDLYALVDKVRYFNYNGGVPISRTKLGIVIRED